MNAKYRYVIVITKREPYQTALFFTFYLIILIY